jgi:Tfp pilus assembly protein PilV
MTLLEVLVALVVLAVGVGAMQRLLITGVGAVGDAARLTEAMLAARALLADAEADPPPLGHVEGEVAGSAGLRFTRDTTATPHAALRQVRVRVGRTDDDGEGCELIEVVRVPAA